MSKTQHNKGWPAPVRFKWRARFQFALVLTSFALVHTSIGAGPPTLIPGFLKFEAYTNIANTTVQSLLEDPNYPNSPASVLYMSPFDTRSVYPDDSHENYGARISGFITPAQSGDYELFLRSDDSSQLFLSPDEDPANLVQIAEETTCCGAFEETGMSETSAPQTLVAGKRYAIQVLYKEGGGGDYTQVAWRKAGDTTPASKLTPIPGAFLSTMIPADGSITITKQPVNVTAAQNDRVTLSLEASGTLSPLIVQWQKNGVSLPGVTGKSVTIGPLAASDANARFSAILSIPGAATNSAEATLTVTPDVTPPAIQSIVGSDTFDTATVDFSEAVTPASAGANSSYTFDNGLTVSSVSVLSPTRVKITTSKQTTGTTYTLTLKDIVDTAGVKSAAGAKMSFPAFSIIPGGLKVEYFFDITGNSVQELLDDPKFQANNPDLVLYTPQFSSRLATPSGVYDNYGARISGFIIPAASGDYEFFLRADDQSQLFLSPDENPTNAIQIAESTAANDPFQEPGVNNATSTPQTLVAGKRYAIYALLKEGTGDDYLDVAWRKVGDTSPAKGLSYIPGAALASLAAPATFTPPTVTISSPANGSSVEVGTNLTLTATAAAAAGKSITKVEFFELTTKLGEAIAPPYSVTLVNPKEDAHKYFARATDSAGLTIDSAPITVSVGGLKKTVSLVAFDSTWKYDRTGRDLGTDWRTNNYDDSSWPQGKTLIADETTAVVEPIRTPISRFNDDGTYVVTFYFRTHFTFSGPVTPATKLTLRHAVDDGAVFYLNGQEIHRFGLAADATYDATTLFGGHENAFEGPYDVPTAALVSGDNVLEAEVHQSSTSSSDIVFGAELIATIPAVTDTLIPFDYSWKYDRTGRDLGTDWRTNNYDDSAWPQGKTLIADETTAVVEPIRTPISRFNDDGTYVVTFYFRTHFNFPGEVEGAKLKLRHAVDDGAVFYLNGQEIHRFGLAADATYDATTLFGGHENAFEGPYDLPTTALVTGDNVMEAEVHQSSTSSSDVVFGAELVGTYFPAGGAVVIPPPSTRITVARTGATLAITWTPSGGTLQRASTLASPINWTDIGSANPGTITIGTGTAFFRIKK
jgi:hypothetical protein